MVKRILVILLFLTVIGTGGYFIYKYYGEAKDYKQQFESVQAQLSSAQAQINEIGAMTTVYQTAVDVKSGDEITETDLVPVSVPESTVNESMKIVPEDVIGKKFRLNLKAGATMSTDLLMTDEEGELGVIQKYPRELTFDALPVTLEVGDYVDIRFFVANGEEYVVLDHAIVRGISQNTVTFFITEEENILINSMYTDLGAYQGTCTAYLYKYLEPGNSETIPFYPVASDLAQFIRFNPNVTDITRLENTTARKHLDETFTILSNNNNSGMAQSIMNVFSTQISMQNAARQTYITDKEEAEAEGVPFESGYDDGTGGGATTVGDEGYEVADPAAEGEEAATGEEEIDEEAIE